MALILDTSVLLAALDQADPDHERCADVLLEAREDRVVPTLVLAELDYWCHERLTQAVWIAFLEDVLAGVYRAEAPSHEDLRRAHQLQSTYSELELGIVDASIMSLAERLGETKVATLDHRHFATIRPRHVTALDLLPS